MGKVTLWKTSKCCGCCIYWTGDRVVNHQRRCIEVESFARGVCCISHGPKLNNTVCPKFEIHGVLKL